MCLLEVIRGRRSIRRYTAQAVSREVVERLLNAAAYAPSAHNRQPWRFGVIESAAVKAALAQAMGRQLRADRLADGDPADQVEADAARSYARLVGAPVVIAWCLSLRDMDHYPDARRSAAERMMAAQSAAMAGQNLLLAAHAEGLGACWLCAPLFCAEVVKDSLALPADWEPQALITLGYPANAVALRPVSRKPAADLSIWR